MNALVAGATGATGRELVDLLLNDERFDKVIIFVRRDPEIQHAKLITHIIDFDKPETWRSLVKGDVLFSCLGTTLKAAGSKEAQWKIDYTYQYEFAKAARENGVRNYVLVSSGMASKDSIFFYMKMKGQLEDDVKKLNFPKLIIFNPPVLVRKNSDRSGEVMSVKITRFINKMGFLKSQKPLPTALLAKAMIESVFQKDAGAYAISGEAIWNLTNT